MSEKHNLLSNSIWAIMAVKKSVKIFNDLQQRYDVSESCRMYGDANDVFLSALNHRGALMMESSHQAIPFPVPESAS